MVLLIVSLDDVAATYPLPSSVSAALRCAPLTFESRPIVLLSASRFSALVRRPLVTLYLTDRCSRASYLSYGARPGR